MGDDRKVDASIVTGNSLEQQTALLERARAGELEAFQTLIDPSLPRLLAVAMRILHRSCDAEDAVQSTVLSAVEHLHDFSGEVPIEAWLRRITVNTALKMLRKQRGLPMSHALHGNDDDGALPLPETIADWRPGAEEQVEETEFRELLEKELDALDEKYRLVFFLRDLEGLSVRDTAHELGINEGTVKVRLMRARLMLRERLTVLLGVAPFLTHDHDLEHEATMEGESA